MLNVLPWRRSARILLKKRLALLLASLFFITTICFLFVDYYFDSKTRGIFAAVDEITHQIANNRLINLRKKYLLQLKIQEYKNLMLSGQQQKLIFLIKGLTDLLPANSYLTSLQFNHDQLCCEGILLNTNKAQLMHFLTDFKNKYSATICKQDMSITANKNIVFKFTADILRRTP